MVSRNLILYQKISALYNMGTIETQQGDYMLPSPLDMLEDIVVNEFTEKSALEFRHRVMKIAKFDPQRPIVIYIDSYGGSVYALGSMISVIEEVPNPFIMVAVGKAMSCGAMLLAAGDYRFADKHSQILIHEVSGGAIGDVNDVKHDTKHIVELNEYWLDYVAKRCGKKGFQEIKDIIKDQDGRNIYLNPEDAKKFGIVDFIGSPVITPVCMYSISNSNQDDPIGKDGKPSSKEKPEDDGKASPAGLLDMLQALAGGEGGEVQVLKIPLPNDIKTKKKTKKKTTKKKTTKKKVTKKKVTKKDK